MKFLTERDLEKIYFGLLGKIIGIRYGAPVEMWDGEEIRKKYGEKEGYFVDYNDFAADDDSNGPIFFFRALEECEDFSRYGSEDVAKCWLNYVPFEHGFYWWGGYGVSEEHTAYLNLQSGILPPASGSIEQNGKVLAEQIGGQIFSDVWGLVSPYDCQKAARLAEIASRVSHDGVAVDGGRFIAALISAAFGAKSVEEMIFRALEEIPQTSLYATMVRDVMNFRALKKTAEECFDYIRKHYWKDKFGGNCHIVPNAAIIVYSLLYGDGDFIKTLKIANYSGFDTDCNVGNLGTIMGVFTELKGVDHSIWIEPIKDTVLCSSILGYENIVNLPTFAYRVFRLALKMRNEKYEGKFSDLVYDASGEQHREFLLPYSASGMRAEGATIKNDGGYLRISPQEEACVYCKTYYGKEDLFDNRYDPAFSPIAYRGQVIRADYTAEEGIKARLFYEDAHTQKKYFSPIGATELKIEGERSALICKIGLQIEAKKRGEVVLKSLSWAGKADYEIDFSKEHMEEYALNHREVSGCTYYRGVWALEDGELTGRCLEDGALFTGKPFGAIELSTRMTCANGNDFGVLFGVQGAKRHSRFIFENGEVRLSDYEYKERTIVKTPYKIERGESVEIKIIVKENSVSVMLDGKKTFDCEYKVRRGCIGAYAGKGSVVKFNRFSIKEI